MIRPRLVSAPCMVDISEHHACRLLRKSGNRRFQLCNPLLSRHEIFLNSPGTTPHPLSSFSDFLVFCRAPPVPRLVRRTVRPLTRETLSLAFFYPLVIFVVLAKILESGVPSPAAPVFIRCVFCRLTCCERPSLITGTMPWALPQISFSSLSPPFSAVC